MEGAFSKHCESAMPFLPRTFQSGAISCSAMISHHLTWTIGTCMWFGATTGRVFKLHGMGASPWTPTDSCASDRGPHASHTLDLGIGVLTLSDRQMAGARFYRVFGG